MRGKLRAGRGGDRFEAIDEGPMSGGIGVWAAVGIVVLDAHTAGWAVDGQACRADDGWLSRAAYFKIVVGGPVVFDATTTANFGSGVAFVASDLLRQHDASPLGMRRAVDRRS